MPISDEGARRLERAYWEEVERTTWGLARVRTGSAGVEVRLLRDGPVLLAFGPPERGVGAGSVSCSYAIHGGLLARAEGGRLELVQERASPWQLRISVQGFLSRLDARPDRPRWRGLVYAQVQARLHRAVGRRYGARLAREARR